MNPGGDRVQHASPPSTGIVVALVREAKSLIQGRFPIGRPVPLGGGNYFWVSGMGAGRAGQAAQGLLDSGCRRLLSWGVVGALTEEVRPGMILLPAKILSPAGASHRVDSEWRSQLEKIRGPVPLACEDLLTMDHLVTEPIEKASLRDHFPAAIVDLEAFAVAQVALGQGVPFAAIKAPLDGAQQNLPRPLMGALDPWGRVVPSRLVSGLARMRGRDYAGLWALMGNDRQARSALEKFARKLGWVRA
jgi:hypothetical protein